ncbi:unnamed protein product [Symbiodinium natans]|uniref:Core-binding (CB) domain-containing protein n=1 Tax=Symbiodinium natans TaxID=878477 RepID=A0A812UIU6_9DINO|nr:unnamed protein product [Symbiodinium natans]
MPVIRPSSDQVQVLGGSRHHVHQAQRIRASGPESQDDRARALKRFRILLLLDPPATRTGRQMLTVVGTHVDVEQALKVLSDTLEPKATGTLTKRVSSLWSYAEFLSTHGVKSPFSAGEPTLYKYLCWLRDQKRGATSGTSTLEALRFSDSMFTFLCITLSELDSPRVKGVAHSLFMTKRRRSPAPLIPVAVVRFLIGLVLDTLRKDRERTIAGQILACIFLVGRWSDLRRAVNYRTSVAGGICILEADAKGHKAAYSKELQLELLPFLGIGGWPASQPWATVFLELRLKYGIQGALPSWNDSKQQWADYDMSTSEATGWLREMAEEVCDTSVAVTLRAHSAKVTLLSWAGTCPLFTREEKTLLGHHTEPTTRSATTYDRNALIRLHAKVHRMLEDIGEERQVPDASAAEQVRTLVQPRDDALPDVEGSEVVQDSSDDEQGPLGLIQGEHRAPVPDANLHEWVQHKLSSMVHAKSSDTPRKLACGRMLSCNFHDVEAGQLDVHQTSFCAQCLATRQLAAGV